MPKTAIKRLRTVVLGVVAISLASCGINSVPTAEETAKARWADVENAYDRRAQLLPNLASVAKSAADREEGILTQVVEARARATSIQVTGDDLDDPAKMQEYAAAQGELGRGLGRLLANFEAYPDLKSITNYQMLQSQVESSENRINIAIRDYNEAVREYNTTIRTFPDIVGAKIVHGAEPLTPFEAVTEDAEYAPDLEGRL